MRSRSLAAFLGLLLSSSALALAAEAASLEGAVQKLGAAKTVALEFSGSGQWFQFGQAPVPGGPWPQFDLSRYEADAYSPLAADAPLPKTANPYAVNLLSGEPGRPQGVRRPETGRQVNGVW